MEQLRGRTALVTGASGGIGRQIARRLADEGMNIVVSGRREDVLVDVNLTAPMLLTHRVVPGMLERGRGHVVFISSLGGKIGSAYNEPYGATKAGLIGLNQALRAEYRHAPIGFSVICPGFTTGDGMYQRMVDEGVRSNRLIGETTTERVADRVVDAIRRDRPELIESGSPIRPMLAIGQLSPRFAEWLTERSGGTAIFRRAAASRGRLAGATPTMEE